MDVEYIVFIIMILIVGALFIFGSIVIPVYSKEKGIKRLIQFIAGFFVMVGAIGFFGSALSSIGGLDWLSKSFEWPVGFANGVISTANGLYVVPHTPSGRIQIYDSEWKFVRGWHVDAGGGTFKLISLGDNRFEVITSRKQMRYVYDTEGNLISKASYDPAIFSDFPKEGISVFVPTKPWLLVFSHPLISWAVFGIGFVTLGLIDKDRKRKKKSR